MGNHIRKLRKARGWSVRDLGERLGVHFTTVARLERSDRRLTYEWAQRFANAFDVAMAEVDDDLPGDDSAPKLTPAIKQSQASDWEPALKQTKIYLKMQPEGPGSFAIEVENCDMVDPRSGTLIAAAGSCVIVDPGQLDLCDGYYFAIKRQDGAVSFVQFLANPARILSCAPGQKESDIMIGRTPFTLIGRIIGVFISIS